jgi:hypothetical protein
MSWELVLRARDWPDLNPPGRLVGMVVASHANRDGRAWPSLDTVAAETGHHRRTVIRAVVELEKRGLFTVLRHTGRPSEYVFGPGYPQGGGGTPPPVAPRHGGGDSGYQNPWPTATQRTKKNNSKNAPPFSTDEPPPAPLRLVAEPVAGDIATKLAPIRAALKAGRARR